jgi:hypothetical protein
MNDNGPPGAKRLKSQTTVPKSPQTTSEPVVRYWEQTADGQRKEKGFEDDALIAKLESSIKDLEDDIGDTSLLEKVDAERSLWEEDEQEEDIEAALSKDMDLPPAMQAQMEAIEAQLRRIENDPDLEILSEEDQLRIRSELLSGVAGTDSEGTFLFYLYGTVLTIKSTVSFFYRRSLRRVCPGFDNCLTTHLFHSSSRRIPRISQTAHRKTKQLPTVVLCLSLRKQT